MKFGPVMQLDWTTLLQKDVVLLLTWREGETDNVVNVIMKNYIEFRNLEFAHLFAKLPRPRKKKQWSGCRVLGSCSNLFVKVPQLGNIKVKLQLLLLPV